MAKKAQDFEPKTITVSKISIIRDTVKKDHRLPTKPIFVQSLDCRKVVGIWPKPYALPPGPERGFKYVVRILYSDVTRFKAYAYEIPDWLMTKRIVDGEAEPLEDFDGHFHEAIDIILGEKRFEGRITEKTFMEHWKYGLEHIAIPREIN